MQYVIDKKWKWVQCNLVIKRLPQKQYQQGIYQSLEAEVELISQEPDIKNFMSDIIMQKTFQFQQGKGFIWHKSWYIPQIIIKLSSKITRMLKDQNHIKKMYCEMSSAYPFKKDEHFYLQQIRLDGDTLKQFNKKGQVTFSNIKFSQTSFNKNKNKFSLILVIYTTYKPNQKSIIKSYISSPIHVDSRKQARKKISANTFIQDEINLAKFINPLQGSQKLINESNSYQDLLTIPGFIKYYTAANVRFKIKHPYYIGYHFHNVFDIYYNSQEASSPTAVLDIIFENDVKQYDRLNINKPKSKKEIYNDNKEILKKTCPKILLFLIKNSPKQCYLVKDQIPLQQDKQLKSIEKENVSSTDKIIKKRDLIDPNQRNLNINNQEAKQVPIQKEGSKNIISGLNDANINNSLISSKNSVIEQPQFLPKFIPNNCMNPIFYHNSSFMHSNNGGNMLNNNMQSIFSPIQTMSPNYLYFSGGHQFLFNNQISQINQANHMISDNNKDKNETDNNQKKNTQKLIQTQKTILQQIQKQVSPKQVKQIKQVNQIKQINQINQNDIKQQQNSSEIIFDQNKDENILSKKQLQKTQFLKEEEYIKKISSIFQSWKFNFVHIKKSDGGFTILNKKWKHITKQQLLESFKQHSQKKAQKMNEHQRVDSGPLPPNGNNFLTYDIHQVIVLQKSKHQAVKMEQNYLNYES